MILNDDMFARVVAEDVKNRATDEQKSYLRAIDISERWRKALYYLLSNLDDQTGQIDTEEKSELDSVSTMPHKKRLEFEISEKYEQKRSKIKRFRFHVEQRLAEADRIILLDGDDSLDVESFLRKAIEQHYELMLQYDMETTSIDESLYDAVRGRWTFGDINPTEFE